MTKEEIQALLIGRQTAVNFNYIQIGVDEMGLPIYKIEYVSPPQQFKLIRLIEAEKIAVLENLTPLVAQDEPTTNA